jgi:UDP-2,3-diacylglucosamine pyrophosphatase LpxH
MAPTTPTDPTLYIFLADLHLPPVMWFYQRTVLSCLQEERIPPNWLLSTPTFRRQRNYLYRNYYSIAQLDREFRHQRTYDSDIFGTAGDDLVIFLNGVSNLNTNVKNLLHFISLGDMFELWLGREYQFSPGLHDPQWRSSESVNLVSDWALEIMIQNTPVLESFRQLNQAGLAEVKFIWGNHDAYLNSTRVTNQLGLPRRDPLYRGLNGDILAEHGHRFDRSNHDNTSAWSGPAGANAAFYMPVLRSAEPIARTLTSIGHPSSMRDCYLLGATLIYLYQRYDQNVNPFSIYVMGHSHDRQLFIFNIRTNYHNYAIP